MQWNNQTGPPPLFLYVITKTRIIAIGRRKFFYDISAPPMNAPGGLLLCLKDLRSELDERQRGVSYLESVTATGGLMTTDMKQVVEIAIS